MRILGVYLCIVLLTISFTVLALGQLADSIEHKDRFNVLRKLGVEEKYINKIVLNNELKGYVIDFIDKKDAIKNYNKINKEYNPL